MGLRTRARLAGALLASVLSLAVAAPASAAGTIPINPGNVPTTAAGFATQECDPNLGGGPFPGEDVWVFVLPQPQDLGQFVSLHLNFSTPNGAVTRAIPPDPTSAIVNDQGTSKAWIRTPAGWTLTNGSTTANITGNPEPGDTFNLTHPCPASGTTPTPTATPTAQPTGSVTASPTKTHLPVTGSSLGDPSLTVPLAVGTGLLLTGVALLVLRRRRDAQTDS